MGKEGAGLNWPMEGCIHSAGSPLCLVISCKRDEFQLGETREGLVFVSTPLVFTSLPLEGKREKESSRERSW